MKIKMNPISLVAIVGALYLVYMQTTKPKMVIIGDGQQQTVTTIAPPPTPTVVTVPAGIDPTTGLDRRLMESTMYTAHDRVTSHVAVGRWDPPAKGPNVWM